MTMYIFIGLLIILFIVCLIRNIPAYTHFTKGAKEALDVVARVFPFLVAIFVAVELFRVSGLSSMMASAISPVLSFVGIPPQLAELMILRPFSGSGSVALMTDVIAAHGTNSYITRCAAIMMSTSETLFYVTAVYFSTVKTKKLGYAIPIALLTSFLGAIIACQLASFM